MKKLITIVLETRDALRLILLKSGIISYPYLDTKCEFGGKRVDTRVKHKKYGLGETLCFAEYHERSQDYYQRVLFDSERENGSYIDRYIPCKELEPIN